MTREEYENGRIKMTEVKKAVEQILNEAKRSEKHSYDIYTYYRDRIRDVCTNPKEYEFAVKRLINILEV